MSPPDPSRTPVLCVQRWVPAPLPPASTRESRGLVLGLPPHLGSAFVAGPSRIQQVAPPPRFAPWTRTQRWARAALDAARALADPSESAPSDILLLARTDLVLALCTELATRSTDQPSRILALSLGSHPADPDARGLLNHLAQRTDGPAWRLLSLGEMAHPLVHTELQTDDASLVVRWRGGARLRHALVAVPEDEGPARTPVERLLVVHGGSSASDSRVEALSRLADQIVVVRCATDPMLVGAKARAAVIRLGGIDGAIHLAAEFSSTTSLPATPRALARQLQPGRAALRALHVALPPDAWLVSSFRDSPPGGFAQSANAEALAEAASRIRTLGGRHVVSVAHPGAVSPSILARTLVRASRAEGGAFRVVAGEADRVGRGDEAAGSLSSCGARGAGHREPRAPRGVDHPI